MTEEFDTAACEVASIKFRNRGKAYFFDPAGLTLRDGDKVVVETAKGLELGDVVKGNHSVAADRVVQPLRPVVRVATADDRRIEELCRKREREAFVIGRQKIADHGLEMKLVDVECSFEGNKILFFFSSDGRVDFRELVKDLASVFRTRIELRQIGVRDEARMLGGLGVCGRPFCCGTFMEEFAPVSTKMAKTQSMSLNPAKISGCCGRLMCCLRYEQSAYEELVKNVPKNGAFVETPDGYGNVTQVNVLRQMVKVKLDGPGDDSFRVYEADEVAAIPGGRPRDGSQPPHVLVLKPKKPKEEPEEEAGWVLPERLIVSEEERPGKTEKPQGSRRSGRNRGRRDGQPREGQENAGKQPANHHSAKQGQGAAKAEHAAGEKSGSRRHKNKNQKQKQNGQPAKENTAAPAANGEANAEQKPRHSHSGRRRHKPKKPNGGNNAPSGKGDKTE